MSDLEYCMGEWVPWSEDKFCHPDHGQCVHCELERVKDENHRLQSFKTAYMEWSDKTEWVQDSAHWSELGKHRADVIIERMNRLSAENESIRKVASELRRWANCEHLHHDKKEQHEQNQQCKVLARIDAALNRSPENP